MNLVRKNTAITQLSGGVPARDAHAWWLAISSTGLDYWIALTLGLLALATYVRTLAPDVLYGDSAEFQTLAYTLGHTHSTGYPIYLLLARLVGLLPLHTFAWRVNLVSALGAAATVSLVYLLGRYVTSSRVAAVLGAIALALSYTFWSQAVIAEVYTPALAFIAASMLLLWRWQPNPTVNNRYLLLAALLAGLGLGVHASVALVAPVALAFVIWTLATSRLAVAEWSRTLLAGSAGALVGLGLCFLAFWMMDLHNPPSSFFNVMLYPSRSIWSLQAEDLQSPLTRIYLSVTGIQWQDAMFPETHNFGVELGKYAGQLTPGEFSPLLILLAALGITILFRASPHLGWFVALAFASMLYFILNYHPPDKYIFYLPTYLLVAVSISAGIGFLLERVHGWLAARSRWAYLALYPLAAVLCALLVFLPIWESRRQALQDGAATFVSEDYNYPIYDLTEPRGLATLLLSDVPDNAVMLMEWRALYSTAYLAHVEQGRTGIDFLEVFPHGGEGRLAESLVQELTQAIENGRPVYVEQPFEQLRQYFRIHPVPGSRLYQLTQ